MKTILNFPTNDEAHIEMPTIRMTTRLREFLWDHDFEMKHQAANRLVIRIPSCEPGTPIPERPRTKLSLLFSEFCQQQTPTSFV